jgi:hypothetical protein
VRWAENSSCTGSGDDKVHPEFPSETIMERVGKYIDGKLTLK